MAYPCSDDPQEVISQILDAAENSEKLDSFVNGTDSETVQLGSGDPTPTLRGVVKQMLDLAEEAIEYDETHPEFLRYYRDSDGKFLWGIRIDGSIEWAAGVPKPVRKYVEDVGLSLAPSRDKTLLRIQDRDGRILFSIGTDGSVDWASGVPKPVKEYFSSFLRTERGDGIASVRDAEGRVLEDTSPDGTKIIRGDLRVNGKLISDSLPKTADWSEASSLKIPVPRCAKVNIIGFKRPLAKTIECPCWMEFWDMQGNYFKKPVIMGLQGNTTWNLPKPNYKFDLLADGWDGDEFKITFGDWVPQDSFHLKAFYTDLFKGKGIVIYKLYEEMLLTHEPTKNRSWKQALLDYADKPSTVPLLGQEEDLALRLDTGAKCHPDAFPCIVYMDGRFHGLFSFQLKKHRKNYHMTKDNPKHVHLDGLVAGNLFGGFINWRAFELRNPSNLYCMDGTEYDGDTNCNELIDETSPYYETGSSKVKQRKKTTAKAKAAVLAFAEAMSATDENGLQYLDAQYSSAAAADKPAIAETIRARFQEIFDVQNVADYAILIDVDRDRDAIANNCQWTTWDGVKWFVNSYDTNDAFGGNTPGGWAPNSATSHSPCGATFPAYYAWKYFTEEVNARYAFLRDSGILSAANVFAMLNAWCKAFGEDFYELERETWKDMQCWSNSTTDARYWEPVLDSDGTPVFAQSVTYDETVEYDVDDTCAVGAWYRSAGTNVLVFVTGSTPIVYKCKKKCKGIPPQRIETAADSIWRLEKWLNESFRNMDQLYGYSGL